MKIKPITISKFSDGYKINAYTNQNNLTKVFTPYFF